jgi:hypothetical protein
MALPFADAGPFPGPGWVEFEGSGRLVHEYADLLWNFTTERLDDIGAANRELDQYARGWTAVNIPEYEEVNIAGLPGPGAIPDVEELSVDFTGITPIRQASSFSIYDPAVGGVPAFTKAAPTLDLSGQPENPPTFSEEAPFIRDVDVPALPALVLPPVPTFNVYSEITPTPLTLPTFTSVMPDFGGITAPPAELDFEEVPYESALLEAIKTKLVNALTGVDRIGFPPGVWEEIVAAAVAQTDADEARLVDQARTEFYAGGWELPAGALVKTTQQARLQGSKLRAAVQRELFIKRAEMEVEQLKFYTSQAIALETVLIDFHNKVADRALRYAEATLNAAVRLMEAELAIYNGKLQAYGIAADVHGKLIQAELLRLEEWRFKLEHQKVKLAQDENAVRIYVARVDAAAKVIDAYEAQVRGIQAKVEVDRTRVQAFGEKVRAFAAQMDGWAKEWDGYRAKMDAQNSVASIFRSEVEAHVSRVQAFSATVQAEIAKVDASAKRADAEMRVVEADTRRYAAEIDARARAFSAQAEVARLPFVAYTAQTEWWRAQAAAHSEELRAAIEQSKAAAQIGVEGARLEAEEIRAQRELGFKALEGQRSIATQLTASALQGINLSASLGTNYSFGNQYNGNASVGWSFNKNVTPA